MKITLNPSDYSYPESLDEDSYPKIKPTVIIELAEIQHAAQSGVGWEQLEKYFNVDQTTLKRHFAVEFARAQSTLQINLLSSMVKSATDGNTNMQKWLSQQWLGMHDRINTVAITDSAPVNEEEINARLESLINKYSAKAK